MFRIFEIRHLSSPSVSLLQTNKSIADRLSAFTVNEYVSLLNVKKWGKNVRWIEQFSSTVIIYL